MASDDNVTTLMLQDQAGTVNFLKGAPSEFAKQLKLLDRANKQAIETLIEIMQTEKDPKIRIMCADKITSLWDSAAKSAANDQLQRLVAQARLGGQGGMKTLVNSEQDSRPKVSVDFTQIRSID